MKTASRLEAATLAVGTEVVDGQITDRNSAWISQRLIEAGLIVSEHRAVPDDREKISLALRELSQRFDILFVTGGLGPTSDDFTRDLISEVFAKPLEFHEPSWQRIVKRFEARGAAAKSIQRQQCFFPKDASVLENPAGTANAFSMKVRVGNRDVLLVALPGPPIEIAAVWETHLESMIESLTPLDQREDLFVWQTFGIGESEIAEKVEAAIAGSNLRVGYRAHLPYVEVKLWVPRNRSSEAKRFVDAVDETVRYATVAKGDDDFADQIIGAADRGQDIMIYDFVSGGYLQRRLEERLAAKEKTAQAQSGSLAVVTSLGSNKKTAMTDNDNENKITTQKQKIVWLREEPQAKRWTLEVSGQQVLAIESSSLYNFGTERARKYAVEKAFQLLGKML